MSCSSIRSRSFSAYQHSPEEEKERRLRDLAGFGIDPSWHVTVNRVDAEEPVHNPGPHHLLTNGLVLKKKKHVHCTVHRSVRDPK